MRQEVAQARAYPIQIEYVNKLTETKKKKKNALKERMTK